MSRKEKSGRVSEAMTFQTTKIHLVEKDAPGSGFQSRELRVGTVLWDRYEVTAVLGASELGERWRCLDRESGIEVSLRWLPPDLRRSKPVMAVIHAGIRRLSDQTHPNLAAIRQMVYVGDQIYLVGDYAPGIDIGTWKNGGAGGKRSLQEVLPVLLQVAAALDFSHAKRIIHRNLKPSEIYLDSMGRVKVTDFGLAPHHHMTMVHGEAIRMGTTGPYLAPELKDSVGGGAPDSASDQYALAILAWELLAGKPPAPGSDAPLPDWPGSARSALRRALSSQPRNRFVTCSDFVKALGGERVPGRRGRSAKEWRRIRIRVGVVAGLIAFCAGAYFGGQALVEWINRPTVVEQAVSEPQTLNPPPTVQPAEPEYVPPPPLIVTTPLPVEGSPWVTQTARMDLIWIFDLQMWVGRYEVTNEQYRRKDSEHSSGEYKGLSLSGSRQPVVRVNFKDVAAYAAWLTEQERAAGKLPEGWRYRLPSRAEAVAYTRAGVTAAFPWRGEFPPTRGNYADESLAKAFPGQKSIAGYNDGFPVTAPVEMSGENDWGLFGAGGNVWETTSKKSGSEVFGGWQGGGWDDYLPERMQSNGAYGFIGNARGSVNGFRLVLARMEDEAQPPPPKKDDEIAVKSTPAPQG